MPNLPFRYDFERAVDDWVSFFFPVVPTILFYHYLFSSLCILTGFHVFFCRK